MTWVYDDGGRAEAGFRGDAGDCVTRAIAICTGLPYREVYDELFDSARQTRSIPRGKASPRSGVQARIYRPYLEASGLAWTPTMGFGTGCRVHLRADELPGGRIITRLSRHLCAVIDGVIHDTFDPARDGTRCVYGYWTFDEGGTA